MGERKLEREALARRGGWCKRKEAETGTSGDHWKFVWTDLTFMAVLSPVHWAWQRHSSIKGVYVSVRLVSVQYETHLA
jgi:hypothetical protein